MDSYKMNENNETNDKCLGKVAFLGSYPRDNGIIYIS